MHKEQTSLTDMPSMEIRHKTLPEEVFEVLSDAILTGALKEGERLNETELALRMGISRAPVREALAELAKQGLAVQVPRKGTFVAQWKKEDLWEVATLRSVLEGLAAKLASSSVEPADAHFFQDVIERMEVADQEGDARQLIDLDLTFHSRIWECARHKRLQSVLEDLKLQTRFFMIVTRPSDVIRYPEQHRTLLEAIYSQDPKRAQQTAIEHVMSVASLALQGLSDDDKVQERVTAFAAHK
jgi:DNA-binding GntR family transcriptional regulator